MTTKAAKKTLAVLLCFVLLTASQSLYGFQTESPSGGEGGGGTEGAPMSAERLNGLLAPIALYPDPLVAQILAASTFPDQVAVADYWVQQNKNLTGNALTQAVDKQTWDSVKALTTFPSVLDNMAKNLNWTSALGEAYHDQPSEVMNAIQALRAQAKEKGNLKSNEQITVVQQSPQTIVIQPANPEVVYVPEYNPALIYGVPYVTPGYTAANVAAAGVIGFGAGIAVGALMSGGGGWGWGAWGWNWHGGAVVYNHNNFYGNTAWHGGYYNGGYHNGYGYHNAYNRNVNNNFNRNAKNNFNHNNLNRNGDNFKRSGNGSGGRASDANSWAHNSGRSNAFSSVGEHSGGWSARADSDRGWGSMRESGFSGGRFGGGGSRGGFGGGGFHGGGFRR